MAEPGLASSAITITAASGVCASRLLSASENSSGAANTGTQTTTSPRWASSDRPGSKIPRRSMARQSSRTTSTRSGASQWTEMASSVRVCIVSASGQNVFFAEILDAFAAALRRRGIDVGEAVDHFPPSQDDLVYVFVPHEYMPLVKPAAHPTPDSCAGRWRSARSSRGRLVRPHGGRRAGGGGGRRHQRARRRRARPPRDPGAPRAARLRAGVGSLARRRSRRAEPGRRVHGRSHRAPRGRGGSLRLPAARADVQADVRRVGAPAARRRPRATRRARRNR